MICFHFLLCKLNVVLARVSNLLAITLHCTFSPGDAFLFNQSCKKFYFVYCFEKNCWKNTGIQTFFDVIC